MVFRYVGYPELTLSVSQLHVNPTHRRVVVCEDLVLPTIVRESLLELLVTTLKTASVTFVPAMLVALRATGHHTALLVDCGYGETRLLPVYKGLPLQHLYTSAFLPGPRRVVSCD